MFGTKVSGKADHTNQECSHPRSQEGRPCLRSAVRVVALNSVSLGRWGGGGRRGSGGGGSRLGRLGCVLLEDNLTLGRRGVDSKYGSLVAESSGFIEEPVKYTDTMSNGLSDYRQRQNPSARAYHSGSVPLTRTVAVGRPGASTARSSET